MTKYPWSVFIRCIVFFTLFLLLHAYSENAFEYARTQEHRGDTGLGIAILLGFTSLMMLVGFFTDLIIQAKKRGILNCLVDAFILVILLMPFGWFNCNWYGISDKIYCKIPLELFSRFLNWMSL